jgi:hypothetical protein
MQINIQSNKTGRILRWVDGQFSGDPAWVAVANEMCSHRTVVALTPTGPMAEADASDPVSAVAVLSSVVHESATLSGDIPEGDVEGATQLDFGAVA